MAFSLPIPPDTAIITDDAGVTGAALIDPLTGVFLGFASLAEFRPTAQESGCSMLDGTIGLPDNYDGVGHGRFGIYNSALAEIATVSIPPWPAQLTFLNGVTTDRTTYWYVASVDSSNNLTIHQLSKSGTHLQSWATGFTSTADPLPMGVTRDNAVLYFEAGGAGVKKLNIATGAITATTLPPGGVVYLGVDPAGFIYINRLDGGGNTVVEKYDATFNLLGTVNGGPTGYAIDYAHPSADDAHLFTWTQKPSGSSHPSTLSAFRKIRLADLAVIHDVTGVPTEQDSNFITEGQEISNSCPMIITGTPPSSDCSGLTMDSMTMDCATRVITITGTGFRHDTIITLKDPTGAILKSPAILEFTDTTIRLLAQARVFGEYCVTLRNPPRSTGQLPPGGGTGGPGGDPSEGIPPPAGNCGSLGSVAGAPGWFASCLQSVGATDCADMAKFIAARPCFNSNGAMEQVGLGCNVRFRLHLCALVTSMCSFPACDFSPGHSFQDVDVEASGKWAWIPR